MQPSLFILAFNFLFHNSIFIIFICLTVIAKNCIINIDKIVVFHSHINEKVINRVFHSHISEKVINRVFHDLIIEKVKINKKY